METPHLTPENAGTRYEIDADPRELARALDQLAMREWRDRHRDDDRDECYPPRPVAAGKGGA